MKNVIKGLSEKKKEEIIHMSLRELYQTGYDAGFADGQASTVEGTEERLPLTPASEGIIHEGKLLRKVDREAREGDYARFGGLSKYYSEHYTENGELYKVLNNGRYIGKSGTNYGVYNWSECPNPEIFEVVEGYNPQIPMYDETFKSVLAPLTANQQRADLIQRAREFVEGIIGNYPNFEMDIGRFSNQAVSATFHVNAEKRTVVALVHGYFSRKLVCKGIAKCMPGDVFNEWIGKAIALAKALEIDIPQEFLDAVQPDEIVVGMIVEGRHSGRNKITGAHGSKRYTDDSSQYWHVDSSIRGTVSIIDDTNAEYEVAI